MDTPVTRQGVGGSSEYYTVDAFYALYHADSTRWQTIQGTVDIAQLTAQNQVLPSLLGWDILQQFKLTVDYPAGTVILE